MDQDAAAGGAAAEPVIPPGFTLLKRLAPFTGHAGPVYERVDDQGLRTFGFRAGPQHGNLGGIVHGGMIATFSDTILGQFEKRDFGQMTVTVRLLIDYVGPARIGDWIEGRSRVVRQTRTLVFGEGEIFCGKHAIARCSAVFRLLDRPLEPRARKD